MGERAATFAAPFRAGDEARMAGLLHDAGKADDVFTRRLEGKASGLDHWTPGAALALRLHRLHGIAATLAIQGHHLGLASADKKSLVQLHELAAPATGRLLTVDDPEVLQDRVAALGIETAVFLYDGRGFLRQATEPDTGATVEPLYDSSGRLHALVERDSPTAPERRHTLFYLAGRPVAQLTREDGTDTWQYLTTDRLGNPLLASDGTGEVTWSGGFEPFGRDFAEGTADAALAADVF